MRCFWYSCDCFTEQWFRGVQRKQRQRIHVGMEEMYEIVHQATYRFFGIDEMYKLVMDEMYEIVWIWVFRNWLKFEYEYSKICVVSVVRAKLCVSGKTHADVVVLVVWVVFVWFVVCYVWLIKLGCIRCRCGMNILNFGLSPLCLVYMKFLMA